MRKKASGRPRGTTGRARVLDAKLVAAVLSATANRPRLAARGTAALSFSIGLGLRAKELAALRWSDLYDSSGDLRDVLHLRAAYTKGHKCRDVYLASPGLRLTIEKYRSSVQPEDWERPLFESQRRAHLTAQSMGRFLKKLYEEAGIARASSHSGRRTMITRLAENGVDLKAISAIAGHANIRTTALYIENNPTRLARILGDLQWNGQEPPESAQLADTST